MWLLDAIPPAKWKLLSGGGVPMCWINRKWLWKNTTPTAANGFENFQPNIIWHELPRVNHMLAFFSNDNTQLWIFTLINGMTVILQTKTFFFELKFLLIKILNFSTLYRNKSLISMIMLASVPIICPYLNTLPLFPCHGYEATSQKWVAVLFVIHMGSQAFLKGRQEGWMTEQKLKH